MSHTPGPWRWISSDTLVGDHGRRPVVLCTVTGDLEGRGPGGALVEFDPKSVDARLIAAAPELLAALRALSGIHGSTLLSKRLSLSNEMAQANAEAILAKLEGV